MNEIVKLGAPVRPVDVQGKIEFNSQFFEPHGSFHARIYYPARYADMDLTISHPVGRWQIDDIAFLPQEQPGLYRLPCALRRQLRLHARSTCITNSPAPKAPPATQLRLRAWRLKEVAPFSHREALQQ